MRLLLFDIDGTLLHSNGAGRRIVEETMGALLGREVSTEGVSFSGKTDRQIFRELLNREDLDGRSTDDLVDQMTEAYSSGMSATLAAEHIDVLPGAIELVARLHREGTHLLGLLTGNVEPMAYLKLSLGGIHEPFKRGERRLLGAFGCDHEERNELPAVAVQRAKDYAKVTFAPHEVVIIGDTPLDIACARAHGCRVVAVATGKFDAETLEHHQPDVLLPSLDDIELAISAIEAT
ncbi:HAD family hydrolase [soil metagenome]